MIDSIDAYIIAGGKSLRFKRDKSLYEFNGKPLIKHVVDAISPVFKSVSIISNDTDKFSFLDLPVAPDIIPELGPIGGIYTALTISAGKKIFAFACDTPFIDREFVEYMISKIADNDIIIPSVSNRFEPLHAIYSYSCLPFILKLIESGDRKIINFFDSMKLLSITEEEIKKFDSELKLFQNINYFEDIEKLAGL
jgi:molybdopterin-guanine dinucleotide biosynthesis protein A